MPCAPSSVCRRRYAPSSGSASGTRTTIAVSPTAGYDRARTAGGSIRGRMPAPVGELLPARLADDRAEVDPLARVEPRRRLVEVEADRRAFRKECRTRLASSQASELGTRSVTYVAPARVVGSGRAAGRHVRAELRELALDGARRRAELAEDARRAAVRLPEDREQEVLGPDLLGAQPGRESVRPLPRARRTTAAASSRNAVPDACRGSRRSRRAGRRIDAAFAERTGRNEVSLGRDEREQDVLRPDPRVAELIGLGHGARRVPCCAVRRFRSARAAGPYHCFGIGGAVNTRALDSDAMTPAAAIEDGVALSRHTTIGTGGPARFFARPETLDELEELLGWAGARASRSRRSGSARTCSSTTTGSTPSCCG